MKRAFYFLVVAFLVAILAAPALSQSGITWDSDITIQNLGTADAEVDLYYYDIRDQGGGGGGLNDIVHYTIPVGANIHISPLDHPTTFTNGSVVIESTEPIAVVVNEMGDPSTYSYNAAYEGFNIGGPLVRLPGLSSCNAQQYSFFNVQNAGSEETEVTVEFVPEPGHGYETRTSETCTLAEGEACTFTQEPDQGQWPACTEVGSQWVGGAKITTDDDQPVVATINIVSDPTLGWGMSSFDGFVGEGSPTAVLINAVNANNNYWSGIGVTNAGLVATTITLKFYPEERTTPPFYPDIDDVVFTNIQPNETAIFLMPDHTQLAGDVQWVGSVVADGGGQNVMAVVQSLNTVEGEMSAVRGTDPDSATAIIDAPIVLSDDGTHPWWSGLQVYNTTDTDAYVDIVFSESLESYCGAGTAWTPTPDTGILVPAKQSIVRLMSGGGQWVGKCYFGAATITSGGEGIIGLGGQIAPTLWPTGEVMNYYNAFNR